MHLFMSHPETKIILDVSHGDIIDTNMFLFFGKPGKTVAYLVWPCVVLSDIVITKGVVQVNSPTKEDDSSLPHTTNLSITVDYSNLERSLGSSSSVQHTSDFEGSLLFVPPPTADADDESKASSDSVLESPSENQ